MLCHGDAVTMSRRLALSIATNDAANLKAVASAGAAARDAGFDDKTLADWNLPDAKSGARTRRNHPLRRQQRTHPRRRSCPRRSSTTCSR